MMFTVPLDMAAECLPTMVKFCRNGGIDANPQAAAEKPQ
jgi:hypothetical protein